MASLRSYHAKPSLLQRGGVTGHYCRRLLTDDAGMRNTHPSMCDFALDAM
jgi:hypothetical protein